MGDNFNQPPEGDGAFICANSWGGEFGDDGYFYVSYYDTNIGIHNILYSGIESADNYDHIYQTDLCGWVGQLGYGKESAFFANIYTAEEKEELEAVGFYATGENTSYQVYTVTDAEGSSQFGRRRKVASFMPTLFVACESRSISRPTCESISFSKASVSRSGREAFKAES